jgi:hypothetical protein
MSARRARYSARAEVHPFSFGKLRLPATDLAAACIEPALWYQHEPREHRHPRPLSSSCAMAGPEGLATLGHVGGGLDVTPRVLTPERRWPTARKGPMQGCADRLT